MLFSPLSSHSASSDFILGHDSELCSYYSQAPGLAPPTKKLAMFTKTSARLGREGICSSRAQGSLANQKLTPLTSRSSLVLNEI